MTTMRVLAAAALIVASAWAPHVALSQAPGTTRNDLQRHDLAPTRGGSSARRFRPGSGRPEALAPGYHINKAAFGPNRGDWSYEASALSGGSE